MTFYHYTAGANLRAIAKHGLTVGDVPTDLHRNLGRIGVWFTTSPEPTGHGLSGSTLAKKRYRLTVDLPASPALVRWSEWAPGHSTPETIANLKECAGIDGVSQWPTWFVLFGVLPPAAILSCRDMATGEDVRDWANAVPAEFSRPAIAPWRREAWQRQMLKQVVKHLREAESHGVRIVY